MTAVNVLFLDFISVAQFQIGVPVARQSEIDTKLFTGIISEQYANGSPALWKMMVNGKADGLWMEWYPNGNLRYRALWKEDKGHGKWEYFYPNGRLRSESFYINDIAQGIYKTYHENGQLEYDIVYMNGRKNGVEYGYDKTGSLVSRKRYENDTIVIDEPVIFEEGTVSSLTGNEWGIHFFSKDTKAYFTRRDLLTQEKRIYFTEKIKGRWTKPLVAEFSTGEDESPFITPKGDLLYFSSFRPLPGENNPQPVDMNIWYLKKEETGWSKPKPVGSVINKNKKAGELWQMNYEAGPITDSAGNLYYWTRSTQTNATNIYFSRNLGNGAFENPVELIEPSNHSFFDSGPQLSPDGNLLFFTSDNRPDGFGGSDIYYSKKLNGHWTKPKNLGPVINTYQDETSISFSTDGKYLFFSSNRGGQKDESGEYLWDIYYMETRFLFLQ